MFIRSLLVLIKWVPEWESSILCVTQVIKFNKLQNPNPKKYPKYHFILLIYDDNIYQFCNVSVFPHITNNKLNVHVNLSCQRQFSFWNYLHLGLEILFLFFFLFFKIIISPCNGVTSFRGNWVRNIAKIMQISGSMDIYELIVFFFNFCESWGTFKWVVGKKKKRKAILFYDCILWGKK